MHRYLRAVGFSDINSRTDFEKILGIIMESPTFKHTLSLEHKHRLVQFNKDFGEGMGISVVGEYDERGFFYLNYYTPYAISNLISSKEIVMINKRVDTDAYTGMCDDMRLGVSLIFYLQNIVDYRKSSIAENTGRIVNICLSALSIEGKVLLGICTDEYAERKNIIENKRRNKLIAEARNGDQDAIDSLTIDELDVYASVMKRAKSEDIYSIVDTSFIPYGSESDNYTIIGTITNWNLLTNPATNEKVYYLLINCNDLIFPVYINELDLIGEPMIGRRFKGNIWMQGNIDFTEI